MDILSLLSRMRPSASGSAAAIDIIANAVAPFIPVRDIAREAQKTFDPSGKYAGTTQDILDGMRALGIGSFHERYLDRISPARLIAMANMAETNPDASFSSGIRSPQYYELAKMAYKQYDREKQERDKMRREYDDYQRFWDVQQQSALRGNKGYQGLLKYRDILRNPIYRRGEVVNPYKIY